MATDTRPRSRLPWQAVVAAFVLAALAATAVIVVMEGGDDGSTAPVADGRLELTPAEAIGEPLDAAIEWPDDGTEQALGEAIDGPTVVNFFASWCAPCVAEMPDFESVHQQLGDRVDFLGLAVNDRTAEAQRIVDQTGVTYRWGRDARGDAAAAAEVLNMPATMFVGADGEVVAVHSGAMDADELRSLIAEHLGVQA